QEHRFSLWNRQSGGSFTFVTLEVILIFKLARNAAFFEICAGVEPGLHANRRDMGRVLNVRRLWKSVALAQDNKLLRIPLFDHTEPAKFTFRTIEVTVVILVTGYQLR